MRVWVAFTIVLREQQLCVMVCSRITKSFCEVCWIMKNKRILICFILFLFSKLQFISLDLTNGQSWEKVQFWIDELLANEENCDIYIVGTKGNVQPVLSVTNFVSLIYPVPSWPYYWRRRRTRYLLKQSRGVCTEGGRGLLWDFSEDWPQHQRFVLQGIVGMSSEDKKGHVRVTS